WYGARPAHDWQRAGEHAPLPGRAYFLLGRRRDRLPDRAGRGSSGRLHAGCGGVGGRGEDRRVVDPPGALLPARAVHIAASQRIGAHEVLRFTAFGDGAHDDGHFHVYGAGGAFHIHRRTHVSLHARGPGVAAPELVRALSARSAIVAPQPVRCDEVAGSDRAVVTADDVGGVLRRGA